MGKVKAEAVKNINLGVLGHVDSGGLSRARPRQRDWRAFSNLQTLLPPPPLPPFRATLILPNPCDAEHDTGKTSLVKAISTRLSTASLDKHPYSQKHGIVGL